MKEIRDTRGKKNKAKAAAMCCLWGGGGGKQLHHAHTESWRFHQNAHKFQQLPRPSETFVAP